ncbi:PREDICTED: uncharacterized protein LOC105150662 [Acromyrmex echinatior]|uniref:uncharacterized protein LOC105150662 n=1 Tax=Acromyrmex echinatior TaxID=103372 RepID=UPI000580C1DD|nr:PREDICTED: uncharacterized protein LOC105150662 [Acromyrmex echinatior]
MSRFISKTQYAIQHILFKTTLTMGFTVISGCFPMLYIQSHILIPQFLSMIMAALQRMYITAWAANDLKEIEHGILYTPAELSGGLGSLGFLNTISELSTNHPRR